MLCERIIEHAKSNPTSMDIKRSKNNKYHYEKLLSVLSSLTVDQLYERLIQQTKNRKKYVTLILHHQNTGGAIHDRLKASEHLL